MMIKKYLTKAIVLVTLSASIIMFSAVGASAKVTQSEAKDLIYKNGKIYNGMEINPEFKEEVSKATLPDYTTEKGIYELTESDENLYYFSDRNLLTGIRYYVGVDTGKLYEYCGGRGAASFSWVYDNNTIKTWNWQRKEIIIDGKFAGWDANTGWYQDKGWIIGNDNNWNYYKDGVMKTGWIYDGGKWYYCNSTGEMVHDTTIDGYRLGSDGAWIS